MSEPMSKPSLLASEMLVGKKYWVRYNIPGLHRVDRTLIAKFIVDLGVGKMSFSGRPQFGTTDLDSRYMIVIREVADHAECHVDRKIR